MYERLVSISNSRVREGRELVQASPGAIFSYFSGCGLLDLGFERRGFEIALANEIHPQFADAYSFARGRVDCGGTNSLVDRRSIEEYLGGTPLQDTVARIEEIRSCGVPIGMIGGPPCPDFSVGGKNRGATGENGRLSRSYFELVRRARPDFFLFENVKGLWRTKKHRTFYEAMKCDMTSEGYIVSDRLCNAIEFGAPQDRDRIILIGFKRSWMEGHRTLSAVESTEDLSEVLGWELVTRYQREVLKSADWPTMNPFLENGDLDPPSGVDLELCVQTWFDRNKVLEHANSSHCFKPRAGLARFKTVEEGDVSRKSFKRLHRWRYSPTVCYGNNEVHLHPWKARRLTVAEALALQTAPPEFCLPDSMSLSAMFKTIGNAVPVRMAEGVAEVLRQVVLSR